MIEGYVSPLAAIGEPPEHRDHRYRRLDDLPGVFINSTAVVEAFVTVDCGVFRQTHIGYGTWLMKKVHVGHDCIVGAGVEIAPLVSIGGECVIEDRVKIGQGAVTVPRITIGKGARIGAGAVVTKDVPAGETWVGNPAEEITRATRRRRLQDMAIADMYGDGCEIIAIEEPRYAPPQDSELEQRQRAAFKPGGWLPGCGT